MRSLLGSLPVRIAGIALAITLGIGAVATLTYFFLTRNESQVLVGAGDIGRCDRTYDEETADLLDSIDGTVFTTGDNVYNDGSEAEYEECYEPSWGRHKARTKPSVGNHDYNTPGASGYYNYFGAAAGDPSEGYYSYDIGAWHVVVLNSNCDEIGGCEDGSPMLRWLEEDLAANSNRTCTLAYWHNPLFSSGGEHGNDPEMKPIWDVLYAAGADVVLNGHEHSYERFAPQDPNGTADSERGIREFVVGTGGGSFYEFGTIQPNSEVRNSDTRGVLKLTLNPTDYDWEFVPVPDQTFTDSGSGSCH